MKKGLRILVILLLIITIAGCGKKSEEKKEEKEETYSSEKKLLEKMEKNNYKAFYFYDIWGNYFDLDGVSYNVSLVEHEPVREFLGSDIYEWIKVEKIMLVDFPSNVSKRYHAPRFIYDINRSQYEYHSEDNDDENISYEYIFNDKEDLSYVHIDNYHEKVHCVYIMKGYNGNEGECTDKYIDKAVNFYDKYERVMKSIDIEEKDIIDLFKYIKNEYFDVQKEKLAGRFRVLSNKEVMERLEDEKISFSKEENGVVLSLGKESSFRDYIYVAFENGKAADVSVKSTGFSSTYIYDVQEKKEYVVFEDNDCTVDVQGQIGSDNCPNSYISGAPVLLTTVFYDFFDAARITVDELVSVVEEYYNSN